MLSQLEPALILNRLAESVSSPEKAGVGGSIPSLATTKSTIYKRSETRFHSVSFQKIGPAGTRLEMKSTGDSIALIFLLFWLNKWELHQRTNTLPDYA